MRLRTPTGNIHDMHYKVTALDFQPAIRLWGNHPFSFVSTRAKYLLKESPEYGGIYLCGNGGKATRSGE